MKCFITLAAATAILAAGVVSAEAHCGSQTPDQTPGMKAPEFATLPFLARAHHVQPPGKATIVGLWHAVYTTSAGAPFQESFETWHSDGTELELANVPITGGNICTGVWQETGPRTIQEFHTAWTFGQDGTVNGTMTIEATNKVAKTNDTYSGTFDFKLYDLNGNVLTEITGTETATRITVD
jgi:hypothetical protein